MELRIAVCDDAEEDRTYVSGLVKDWAAQAGHQAEITAFSSAESFLFRYAEDKNWDILLLDIEMGAMDGVSLAKRVRKDNEAVQIVFVTGYSDYIAEGYEVAALHYLMKPVSGEKLFAVLNRALEKRKRTARCCPCQGARMNPLTGRLSSIHRRLAMSFFSKQIDKRIAAYQRELIETHYREVENMYRQIRGWRHDYRNHIQMMKVLAANGDMDALKAYLDELDTDLNTVDTVVKTGNPMADAILNSKISLARSRNIPTQVDAHIPVKLKMSELDLCCIIGNLFDNAMEASMALPEEKRMIRVYMDMKGTQLYISFTNFTAAKKLSKVGKGFKTSKGEGHGFGLVRIDDIVSRYDGYLSRNSEDGAFTTEILIPQV